MNKKPQKKKIIIVGSDSAISENLQKRILQKNDLLTTISRREYSKFKNKAHFCTNLSDIEDVKALSKKN